MSPTLLCEAGEALYGSRWQSDLAGALAVSDRTMRYWITGKAMPPAVWLEIAGLIQDRERSLPGIKVKALKIAGQAVSRETKKAATR